MWNQLPRMCIVQRWIPSPLNQPMPKMNSREMNSSPAESSSVNVEFWWIEFHIHEFIFRGQLNSTKMNSSDSYVNSTKRPNMFCTPPPFWIHGTMEMGSHCTRFAPARGSLPLRFATCTPWGSLLGSRPLGFAKVRGSRKVRARERFRLAKARTLPQA